ncbi:AraC family transcriptional regulator [Photobacterium gaetbulicola]|uniref:AraC/XylS family transcriptional regulator n=1 Tax=Photobacterium gaetbulicola Gung47 TaxID=658445 RepID=A0A0C5WIL1_9GAMM|nr:AraC family transcriptional regulator [Photobacterium gaetbulicola]AJR06968.1 AraC/XylS family transcriptional regulator [Photobacterium gaetbulicola Gung47]PSU05059.1 AraC family transcriptional regulator [Photobacterium gaetbulicola]
MNKISHRKSPIDDINLIDAHYQSFAFKRHYHLDYHVGLITQGQQQYFYNGSKHIAGAGQLVIMPPDEIHDGQPKEQTGYQVKVFSITPGWLSQQAEEVSGQGHYRFPQNKIADHALFRQLTQLHQQLDNPMASQLAKDSLPIESFSYLLTRYGQVRETSVAALGGKDLHQLRDYVMAHLDQKISLEQLAGLCDLSPSQLLRQFKKATGMTPYAWLARLRLEHAMALLKAGYTSTEVAYHVGFYDQAHFTHAFKQTFGVAPSQIK